MFPLLGFSLLGSFSLLGLFSLFWGFPLLELFDLFDGIPTGRTEVRPDDDDDDGRVDGATEGPASVPRTEASLLPAETSLTRTEGSLLHPLVSHGI